MEKSKLSLPSTLAKNSINSLKSSGSATGNPRNKHALKPGCSLMDWIRLVNSGADLSGTSGQVLPVLEEELAKHNKVNDAWLAIRGSVYNVTRYIEFHPGGTEELMRGVGTDATKLFCDAHAWVNYSQLLNKCFIGPLICKDKIDTKLKESFSLPDNKRFTKLQKPTQQSTDVLPRLDWLQQRDDLTLIFYTKQYCNPGLIIRKQVHEDTHLEIWILIGINVHRFDFKLKNHFNWPPKNVHIFTESGKIEVKLSKHERSIWDDLGNFEMSTISATLLEKEISLEYAIQFKDKFNSDSFVMSLQNESITYILPVGYHLSLEDSLENQKITKCYTPVPTKYTKRYTNTEMDVGQLHFLIKFYRNANSFSQHIYNLEKNTKIKVSLPQGNLKLSTLATHKKFCLLAAGSGLTPFLSLIDHLLNRNANRIEVINLLYFNKTKEDIWCNETLQDVSNQDGRFKFVNILSKADQFWSGLSGKVRADLFSSIVNKSEEHLPFIAACGPNDFIERVKEILNEMNFPSENLFVF